MSDLGTPTAPPTGEDATSQIPALHMLQRLGWKFLSPLEAAELRGGRSAGVVLTTVLEEQIGRSNYVDTPDGPEPFGREAIAVAMQKLLSPDDDGLVTTNERVWDLLRLGTSIQVTVGGRRRGHPFRYVDWDQPERNVFHVTEEFAVDRRATGEPYTRRPDLVCFVNGIPFAVLECKRDALPGGDSALEQAISQHLRNQRQDEIPRLFHYAQVLLALAVGEAKYAVTGTPASHWSTWREREFEESSLKALLAPAGAAEIQTLRHQLKQNPHRRDFPDVERCLGWLASSGRQPTKQDRLLQAILTPSRLLEIVRHYTIFEKGDSAERKVARYQQYFCVRKCLKKVRGFTDDGRREGGIVWHTQGSGKSLTMFLLATRLLTEHAAESPRVVVVTDRIDLDDQIQDTFRRVGADVAQAGSSNELEQLLRSPRSRVITTTIHKFETFTKNERTPIDDANIFVLVDEGHRTQTGTLHASMRKALPKASLFGFTGTPILRGDKQTALAFGGIIDTYTIRDAVEDGAVVNLVYEGRHSDLQVNADPIDTWIAHHTRSLDAELVQQLKQRYSSIRVLNETKERIARQAMDISLHFKSVFQSGATGFKAQLVTPSKVAAIRYKEALDEIGLVSSEVLISAPDSREGNTTVAQEDRADVQKYWDDRIKEYGSEEKYRNEVIRRFKSADRPEIIIVVDMLLTGFDAPRNACLYLTRKLQGHTLLQAIARVNRVYAGKDHGLIVDYYGVVQELDDAVDLYSTFEGDYDRDDLAGVLTDIRQEIRGLPDAHKAVWAGLAGVPNDLESHVQKLREPDDRKQFYGRVSEFGRSLKTALGSDAFWTETPKSTIERYQQDLQYFLALRRSLALRYAERVDFGRYDAAIRKLLDEHVSADEPETIIEPVTIFDESRFEAELESFESAEAKAEVIANRLKREIHAKIEEDPEFFETLGQMLQAAWDRYHEERMSGGEFLQRVRDLASQARERESVDDRTVYHDVVRKAVGEALDKVEESAVASLSETIDQAIRARAIIDWQDDPDAQNRMKLAIEDAIFEWQDAQGVDLGFDAIDRILDKCIDTARVRSRR